MSKTLVFEELTVGEILGYADLTFCDDKYKYMAFGHDVRGAWEFLFQNASEYNRLRASLGQQERKKGIEAIAKYSTKHLKASQDEIEELLERCVPGHWLLTYTLEKEEYDSEFEYMMDCLFDRIKSRFGNTDMTITRKKKSSKGKE